MSRQLMPTDSELEILQLLWKNGSCSVKQIHEAISERREVGYTTVLKLMQIMAEKGICSRKLVGKLHLYEAKLPEQGVKRNKLKNVIDQVFEGSAMNLVMQTLGHYEASKEEIKELKILLEQMEKKN
ncbi:MAG TPA: BlaI/MecI/CopY family transcriptional regulator [Saprospiraceae bacterium]|nr:BlaI/MecI/CopY family transcriptional regulator [Saprospiraceae bacterium]